MRISRINYLLSRYGDLIAQAFITTLVTIIAYPLLTTNGLPSFKLSTFSSATIAYYISWAKEFSNYGWFTPAWCGGFDLIRFYPPIPLLMIYVIGKLLGSYEVGAYVSYYIALLILAEGFYFLTYEFTKSIPKSLLALLALFTIHGYLSTIAIYWEYTRVFGEGFMFMSLAYLNKLLSRGDVKIALITGLFMGLTILTHLIMTIELMILALPTLIYWLVKHYRLSIDKHGLKYLINLIYVCVLTTLAIASWWVIPAIAPFGLAHYLRIKTSLILKLKVITEGLKPLPPTYVPSIQLPYIILGLLGFSVTIKRRNYLPIIYCLVTLIMIFTYGQGLRLLPDLGAFLVITYLVPVSSLSSLKVKTILLTALLITSLTYGITYLSTYHDGLTLDYSYLLSDEYKVSKYLVNRVHEGFRVYLMYGSRFHGNQWVNVFEPRLWQVLSCYMEGCIFNKDCILLDNIIKYGADVHKVKELINELCIKYLVVDRAWYLSNRLNIIKALANEGFIKEDSISRFLKYSIVFRVTSNNSCNGSGGVSTSLVNITYFTPSRIIGILVSVASLAYLIREVPKLI